MSLFWFHVADFLCTDKIGRAKPNLNVLKEYKKREAEFLSRHDDLEKVISLRDDQKKKYEDLRKQRLEEFMAGFSTISLKLKEMYQVRRRRMFVMLTTKLNPHRFR